ncbi:hypothetical protein GO986_19560 [Deinococcus sp. HMF7620]|uniref:Lipoprotein n=1 Tax=Deinococcus arboris TaxID=2682977 RepID=A0A7C9M4C4_9DEIO|nr:hypothetical protein [Deinococcus arboris]MVN88942.1 hypothetical protein [Deinococcus arboris]
MKRVSMAAVGVAGLLASCNVVVIPPDYIGDNSVQLRTTFIQEGTNAYVACDRIFFNDGSSNTQNIVVAEFAGSGFNLATLELTGDISQSKTAKQFPVSDLRTSNRGNYLIDYVVDSGVLPASVEAQAIATKPLYRYVRTSNVQRGRFNGKVTVSNNSSSDSATSQNYIPVYTACTALGDAVSPD